MVIAFFGIGAYQQMLSGRGGAHHCLTPEMRRIIIESEDDALIMRETAPQHLNDIMVTLGYHRDTLEIRQPANVEQSDSRERANNRPLRMPVRRVVRAWKRATR